MAYVDSVLDQLLRDLRGTYRHPDKLKRQAKELIGSFPGLNPIRESFVFNDGRSAELVKLKGTVPIYFKKNFPDTAPLCFVEPTPDMKIKVGHKNVDGQGMIFIPTLATWNSKSSVLKSVALEMSAVFSVEPPLFKSIGKEAASASGFRMSSSKPDPEFKAEQFSDQDLMAMTPKEKAVEKVARKIRAKLNVSRNETISKMENLYSQQGKLNDARSTLKKSIQKLTDEKKSLTSSIETLEGRIKELELWLHEEEANKEDIPVDQAIIPIDTWSRQLFDAVAEDHALEDIMYVLDQAVEEGGLISLDEFLKTIRKLARKQYSARALTKKIYLKQNDAK